MSRVEEPINRLDGKICLITGANSGIGRAAAIKLAELGAHILVVSRGKESGQVARDTIKARSDGPVDLLLADLSSQASIRTLAEVVTTRYGQLDLLFNNAAHIDITTRKPVLTEDGVETFFATNHLAPFLLTNLLLPTLTQSAPSRVINIASKGLMAYQKLGIDFDDVNGVMQEKFSPERAYYHSKKAHIMFTYALARRLRGQGVTANVIRVPSVRVNVAERYPDLSAGMRAAYALKSAFAMTPEKMADTYVYLAASPRLSGVSGRYFDENHREVKSSPITYDEAAQERLWELSAELTGLEM